jgi:hypothetical protein
MSGNLEAMDLFHGRAARSIENEHLAVVVLPGGGHIAGIVDKRSGVNPLWIPPWPSVEPTGAEAIDSALYGSGTDASLLAGIMGHNLCLDIFGGPSDEEAAAGLTAHGEGSIALYDVDVPSGGATPRAMTMAATFALAAIRFERRIELRGRAVRIRESIDSLSGIDRPIGWTQHVTLGPPFLEKGLTEFRASATRSKVFEGAFGTADYLEPAKEFVWPQAPRMGGGSEDLRVYNGAAVSSAFTAHLMDPAQRDAFFVAFSPRLRLAFGYLWRQRDFPWLGIWEENHSRTHAPWSGRTMTRGLEFGVSPFPESRRAMVERGQLFGTPTFQWLPARGRAQVEYWAFLLPADTIPERLERPSDAESGG